MTKFFLQTFLAVVILLTSGCNGDIFVEPAPDIEDFVALTGDGSSATIKIRRKGLVKISLSNNATSDTYFSYYGADGNWIPDCSPMSQIAKVKYYGHKIAVECRFNGDDMEIVALDNAYDKDRLVWINLDYGHTVKNVDVQIAPGKPLEIVDFYCFAEDAVAGSYTQKGIREFIHNNSDRPLRMAVYPYKDAKSRLRLTSDNESYWSFGCAGQIPVPVYMDGEWSSFSFDGVEAEIDAVTFFTSSAVDQGEQAWVEVPPFTSYKVEMNVEYATLESGYEATVKMPNADIIWTVQGKMKLAQPVGYTMETTVLDL